MNSVCTINSVHDIDYNSVKEGIETKLMSVIIAHESAKSLKDFKDNLPYVSIKLNRNIDKEVERFGGRINELMRQSECEHISVRFHENVGHTHGGEIFKTYCTECKYEFERYQI